jgi:radical SAM protein with 4Fe4S-binding SPASM domain
MLQLKRLIGYPYYIVLDPSNVCQLHCPFCDGRKRPRVQMTLRDFKGILACLGNTCINLELYNWGEPFLNEDIIEMINYASQKYKIYTRISSNLNLSNDDFYRRLVSSRLNSLTISLDGASEETYQKYRVGGSFDRVLHNIMLMVNCKKYFRKSEPKLVWQFLVFKHNQHEIEKAKRMAEELSVDQIVFQKPYVPMKHSAWDSSIEKFSNYSSELGEDESPVSNKKDRLKCNWPFSCVVINANGSVSPCCAVALQEDDFGNVFNSPFSAIWNNEDFLYARDCVSQNIINEKDSNICARCPMKGSINYAPSFLQLLYYTIRPLRLMWMRFEKFKVING